ncbi:MAG TPA: carbamoyltransferase HypF [Thermoanaerobaculia bacterium]|jgi:hydrogenase maturation protein HypF
MPSARFLRVRGVVQGVGFRPFVYRLAREHGLTGWVRNGGDGVEIHAEGEAEALDAFARGFGAPPPASRIADLEVETVPVRGCDRFEIRDSEAKEQPTARISPDLPVCPACLAELFDPADRRFGYPYINCTDCGPRYSIVLGLPYDRPLTTMRDWPMCADCAREYHAPLDRRFHAQPVACPACGPTYVPEISETARLLRAGGIVAIKGLGGYHLAVDARDAAAVAALRERKVRKEKPFAVMAKDLATARSLVDLSPAAEALLTAAARPVVLAPRRVDLPGVAPDNLDLGVMLPYTPVHHLLFAANAPDVLVMTSANRSSEPLAYRDEEAFESLAGIADAFLVGERPIARRVDDSVIRAGCLGSTVLRRARGLAPGAVAKLPVSTPVLAVGADLKNTVTLVVGGEAFVSQHVGDLRHYEALKAFRETIQDLLAMYEVDPAELTVVHDLHPQYASTAHARELPARRTMAVQHHRAHVASVLAEKGAFDRRVLGVAFDGTGYGDDGAIWGGELFVGSLRAGFERVGHLRAALLPGGDAAAAHPVQAAAGFLAGLDGLPDLTAPPFNFPERYLRAWELVVKNLRTFPTTSAGRLFDTVAALLGFTREMSFEGQAALWLEQLARRSPPVAPLPLPFVANELDTRPLLAAVAEARVRGRDESAIARGFHAGLAAGLRQALSALGEEHGVGTVVLSGGVFQNELLLEEILPLPGGLTVWSNREVPANDGGISLGQAALAAAEISGCQSGVDRAGSRQ